ncbi:hypothetical protein CCGE531_15870 [Rhizobium sp. CCGE531]|nr:hypothetical protein CCGE531_15870 [Rhizobium sp. CCGE531]AYG73726.1 hypothetical protein CCGE532_15375 [Rhizobium sp. CCGE532]
MQRFCNNDMRKIKSLLHNSLNRNRFKGKIMQHFKVLQRPWRVLKDARRCNAHRANLKDRDAP